MNTVTPHTIEVVEDGKVIFKHVDEGIGYPARIAVSAADKARLAAIERVVGPIEFSSNVDRMLAELAAINDDAEHPGFYKSVTPERIIKAMGRSYTPDGKVV